MWSVRDKFSRRSRAPPISILLQHIVSMSMVDDKGREERVKQFMGLASGRGEAGAMRQALERTAEAFWEADRFRLDPMDPPPTLEGLKHREGYEAMNF